MTDFKNKPLFIGSRYPYVNPNAGWQQRSTQLNGVPDTVLNYIKAHGAKAAGAAALIYAMGDLLAPVVSSVTFFGAIIFASDINKWVLKAKNGDGFVVNGGQVEVDYNNIDKCIDRASDWHSSGSPQHIITDTHSLTDWNNTIYAGVGSGTNWEHKTPSFVFLDCGRWKGKARDFGLIWGRHVYLCSYDDGGDGYKQVGSFIDIENDFAKECKNDERLDYVFFKNFSSNTGANIRLQAYTISDFGEDDKYDYTKVTVIIPDLHLMSVANGKQWYTINSPKHFKLDAEVALLDFAIGLQKLGKSGKLSSNLKIIQIGDSYDLWVGGGTANEKGIPNKPMFSPKVEQKLEILDVAIVKLCTLIKNIQFVTKEELMSCNKDPLVLARNYAEYKKYSEISPRYKRGTEKGDTGILNKYLNPAELAMRILEDAFKDDFQYIYGNHDNYLIDDKLTAAAGLKKREPFINESKKGVKSVFVEHAHRMEAGFKLHQPRNFDGCVSGFEATYEAFTSTDSVMDEIADIADVWAGIHDQTYYQEEYARFWLGRKSKGMDPYNICVIGHTHMPALYNNHFCKIEDAAKVVDAADKRMEEIKVERETTTNIGGMLWQKDPFDSMQ